MITDFDWFKRIFGEPSRGPIEDDVILEFFRLYDNHFSSMFSLDNVFINTLGIENENEIDEILIPKLVDMGIYPVDEEGNPVYDRDKFVKYCDFQLKSSVFFAVERLRIYFNSLHKEEN